MKRILYICMAIAMIVSFSLVSGKSYAAHESAATISIRLCSSAPIGVAGDQHLVQGIFNGVSTATNEWRARFAQRHINVLAPLLLDDAKGDGSAVDAAKEASNARQCVSSSSAFAYIGTLNSSMAQVSEPILNQRGMLMISPANSNPILTNPAKRSTYEPATYNHTLKYPTYYRVVTTDSLQGPVGAIYMGKRLHIKNFFLADDGQTYGVGLAQKMSAYATQRLGMTTVGNGRIDTSSAGAIATSASAVARQVVAKNPQALYCGCDEPYAGPMEKAARRAGFKGFFVGGDAINDNSFGKFAGGNANLFKTYSSFVGNPAFIPASFKASEKRFFPSFSPGPYDALAYDASNIAFQAIMKASQAGKLGKGTMQQQRASILPYVSNVRWKGTIGTISFDHNGDTTLRVLTMWNWKGSSWNLLKVYTNKNIPGFLKPTP